MATCHRIPKGLGCRPEACSCAPASARAWPYFLARWLPLPLAAERIRPCSDTADCPWTPGSAAHYRGSGDRPGGPEGLARARGEGGFAPRDGVNAKPGAGASAQKLPYSRHQPIRASGGRVRPLGADLTRTGPAAGAGELLAELDAPLVEGVDPPPRPARTPCAHVGAPAACPGGRG